MTGPGQWIRNGFKVGPNYCRPPAPVAEEWIQANDPSVQNRHLQDWWQVFEDPTLNSLIAYGLRAEPDPAHRGHAGPRRPGQQAIAVGNHLPPDPASDRVVQPRGPQSQHGQ